MIGNTKFKKLIFIFVLIEFLFLSSYGIAKTCAGLFIDALDEINVLDLRGEGKISFINLLDSSGRKTPVYGNANMLTKVDSTVLKARHVLEILGGKSTDEIKAATSLFGSVAQPKIMQGFSDVDMETLLVVQTQAGRGEALSSPNSSEIKLLSQYFQDHVEAVLREHPEFIFIELKAGEFVSPVDNEVHGIKWNLRELQQGTKFVYEKQGLKILKLEDVLAENARVKADWAIPSIQNEAPLGAYQEASVIYRFALQVGRNQLRLRSGYSGDVAPFRQTTIFFDAEETNIIQKTSQGRALTPAEEIHRLFISSLLKSPKPDLHKLLKRLYVLLQFWESPELLGVSLGKQFVRSKLETNILNITTDPDVLWLVQLRSQALLFQILEQHKIKIPNDSLNQWLSVFGSNRDLEKILNSINEKLNKKIDLLLVDQIDIKSYIEVIKNRIPLSTEKLEPQSHFISVKPSARWIKNYKLNLIRWRHDYPNLDFEDPKNLHMTISFLGLMTPLAIDKLKTLLPPLFEKWHFTEGGVHIFGKENNAIVVLFNEQNNNISDLKMLRSQALALGARVNFDHLVFAPHITIAKINKANVEAGLKERDIFLINEDIADLEEVDVSNIGIYKRNQNANSGEAAYKQWREL